MKKQAKTHIYCYDDHRGFSEDIRKRFSDTSQYNILSFQTSEEFLNHLKKERDYHFCKIAILGFHETHEQFELIEKLTIEIKGIDHRTGLILIGPADKIEDIKKMVKFNIDEYIPKNTNSVLRIHNVIQKLISEHKIGIYKKRRNFYLYILLTFIILAILLILMAYLKLPQYF